MYAGEFICISDKKGLWYQFKGHRWIELDTPIELRKIVKQKFIGCIEEQSMNMRQKTMLI